MLLSPFYYHFADCTVYMSITKTGFMIASHFIPGIAMATDLALAHLYLAFLLNPT